jgi:glycosyltransferase involved in cell wall biosynthesis
VIVATYNRPVLLAETLAAIERQTYPSLEIIVVNDAGADVRDVVARFPRARLIDQPENRGPAAARNRGLADARGTFATLFDDDDEMFPDHVATLANALIVSGLDVAYGQMINAFVTKAATGRYVIDTLAGHDALLDHADIQWAGALATTAVMFRRALVERIGTVDESLVAAEDYEFWYRLAEAREWVRVREVSSIYFVRRDGSNRSATGARRYFLAHQAIYGKHPSARPLVCAGRTAMLELFGQTAAPNV